ncbi:hypothetical protein NMY22_g17576 [Coprinellus aureogranulatus]|nr:hypothetical protein NMY22_g17576 [Coprinellus aureogranulatus]
MMCLMFSRKYNAGFECEANSSQQHTILWTIRITNNLILRQDRKSLLDSPLHLATQPITMLQHLDPIEQEIRNTLSEFQAQLFPTLRGGDSALSAFLSTWKSFEGRLRECASGLQAETLDMVLSFSSLVASVTHGLAEALSLSENLLGEISNILDDSSQHEKSLAQGMHFSLCLSTHLDLPEAATSYPPAYIQVASEWLVANIHNPYPSSAVRDSIAKKTSSPRKNIDNWFLDVRKRIGWNDIRRKHFDNKRVNIVDAAERFFLNTDPSRPLPRIIENEFANVQLRIHELYSAKFEESRLAVQLANPVTNLMLNCGQEVKPSRKSQSRKIGSSVTSAALGYPTPQSSPATSPSHPVLSPTPSLSELPPPSSKRAASVLDDLVGDRSTISPRLFFHSQPSCPITYNFLVPQSTKHRQ